MQTGINQNGRSSLYLQKIAHRRSTLISTLSLIMADRNCGNSQMQMRSVNYQNLDLKILIFATFEVKRSSFKAEI